MCAGPDALVSSNEAAAAAQQSAAPAVPSSPGPSAVPAVPDHDGGAGPRRNTALADAGDADARARAPWPRVDPSRVAEPPRARPTAIARRARARTRPRGAVGFPRPRRGLRGARARGSRTVGPRPTPPAFQTASDLSRRAETSWLDVGASEKPCVAEGKKRPRPFSTAGDFFDDALCERFGRDARSGPSTGITGRSIPLQTRNPRPSAGRAAGGWVPRRRNVRRARIRGRVPVAKTPPRPRRRLRAPRRDAKYFASREIEFGDVFAREISRRAHARRAERLRAAHGPARGSTGHGNGPVRAKVRKPEPARDAARGGGAPAPRRSSRTTRVTQSRRRATATRFSRDTAAKARVSKRTSVSTRTPARKPTVWVSSTGCSSTPWTTSSGPRRKSSAELFARLRARQRRAAHNPTHAQAGYRARSRRARVRAAIDRELALRRRPAHQQGAAHRAPRVHGRAPCRGSAARCGRGPGGRSPPRARSCGSWTPWGRRRRGSACHRSRRAEIETQVSTRVTRFRV